MPSVAHGHIRAIAVRNSPLASIQVIRSTMEPETSASVRTITDLPITVTRVIMVTGTTIEVSAPATTVTAPVMVTAIIMDTDRLVGAWVPGDSVPYSTAVVTWDTQIRIMSTAAQRSIITRSRFPFHQFLSITMWIRRMR